MKKVLFLATTVALFTACQKEQKPTMAGTQKSEDVTAQVTSITQKIQNTQNVFSFSDRKGGHCTTNPGNCTTPMPIAVGSGIGQQPLSSTGKGVLDVYVYYKFFWPVFGAAYVGQAKMTLSISYAKPNRIKVQNTYSYVVSSFLYDPYMGVIAETGIEVPVGIPITFVAKGYNDCGGQTSYTFNWTYSSPTARSAPSNNTDKIEILDWLNKAKAVAVKTAETSMKK